MLQLDTCFQKWEGDVENHTCFFFFLLSSQKRYIISVQNSLVKASFMAVADFKKGQGSTSLPRGEGCGEQPE